MIGKLTRVDLTIVNFLTNADFCEKTVCKYVRKKNALTKI